MYSPAEHVTELFRRLAPAAADIAAPFIERLFQAWESGHAFIRLSPEESEQLLTAAAPVVGRRDSPLIVNGNRLFFARTFQLERELAQQILRLSTPPPPLCQPDAAAAKLQQWFQGSGSRDQQAAAALTLINGLTLISGGPGTGKTTTVAKLLALLCGDRDGLRIALSAPTGKAAARLSQALHRALSGIDGLPETVFAQLAALEGQTVHRLLALAPPHMRPYYHADNRLPLDILVLDEASMLDSHLMLQLLHALPDGCRLILLGDADQLPSVGAGAVLSALIQGSPPLDAQRRAALHGLLPETPADSLGSRTALLRISHRFDSNSGIGVLARAVLAGDPSAAEQAFARFPDSLQRLNGGNSEQCDRFCQVRQDFWQAAAAGNVAAAFARHADLSVLAVRRSDAERFNHACAARLRQQLGLSAETAWFAGQLLLITHNDPDTGLFNGDIGIVMPHNGRNAVWFEGRNTPLPPARLPEHETAFAVTVHKSQGSEYDEVWLLPPDRADAADFSRALLYTAITRAKQRFVYWGSADSFQAACTRHVQRRTALSEWLQEHTEPN